jgi:fucose permease
VKNSQPVARIVVNFAFLMLLLAFPAYGQTPLSGPDFWNRVRYGGGIGLGFGNDTFCPVLFLEYSATKDYTSVLTTLFAIHAEG